MEPEPSSDPHFYTTARNQVLWCCGFATKPTTTTAKRCRRTTHQACMIIRMTVAREATSETCNLQSSLGLNNMADDVYVQL